MSWMLTIVGDCRMGAIGGMAVMVVPVTDKVHDAPDKSVDVVEQLVCEHFHEIYPWHCICEITWTREETK